MLFTLSLYPLLTLLFFLTNVISEICCHAVMLCVTCMSSILSIFKLFFVGVCVVHRCLLFTLFRKSSKGSVTMCLSNRSQWYWLAVICVGFTCLLFLVITCPVFITCIVYDLSLWLWSTFHTIVPWVCSPPSSH